MIKPLFLGVAVFFVQKGARKGMTLD